jgi:hypothetical protein
LFEVAEHAVDPIGVFGEIVKMSSPVRSLKPVSGLRAACTFSIQDQRSLVHARKPHTAGGPRHRVSGLIA